MRYNVIYFLDEENETNSEFKLELPLIQKPRLISLNYAASQNPS